MSSFMERHRDKYLKKSEEGVFSPLKLSILNIDPIAKRCINPAGEKQLTWNAKGIADCREDIRYMLGQLDFVHKGKKASKVVDCRTAYTRDTWTSIPEKLSLLLNLASACKLCYVYKIGDALAVVLSDEVTPTLSPNDPEINTWWERNKDAWGSQHHKWENRELSQQETIALLSRNGRLLYDAGLKDAAFVLLKKAGTCGHADAQYWVAKCYDKGAGTAQNAESAFAWAMKAADQGHADAQYFVSKCCYHGKGTSLQKEAAFTWALKAANQGNVQAQDSVAFYYCTGSGVSANKELALHWAKKAKENGTDWMYNLLPYFSEAEKGDTEAQYYVAKRTQAVSSEISLMWFEKAANQGHAAAAFYLAAQYAFGEEPEFEKAVHYLQVASRHGHKISKLVLHYLHPPKAENLTAGNFEEAFIQLFRNHYGDLPSSEKQSLWDHYHNYSRTLQRELESANIMEWEKIADQL